METTTSDQASKLPSEKANHKILVDAQVLSPDDFDTPSSPSSGHTSPQELEELLTPTILSLILLNCWLLVLNLCFPLSVRKVCRNCHLHFLVATDVILSEWVQKSKYVTITYQICSYIDSFHQFGILQYRL